MALLSDEMLIHSYNQAVQLQLDEDFIVMLLAEMHKRRLRPTEWTQYQIS